MLSVVLQFFACPQITPSASALQVRLRSAMGSFVLPEAFLTFIGTYPHYSISLLVYRLVHAPVISLTARKRGSTPRQRVSLASNYFGRQACS